MSLKADWHWVAERFSEDPVTRPLDNPAVLPSYNYFNFGAGFAIPGSGTRVNVDLLNAFQSKGLEEGNPRLVVGRWRAGLPGPADPAAAAAGVGDLRLRRQRPGTAAVNSRYLIGLVAAAAVGAAATLPAQTVAGRQQLRAVVRRSRPEPRRRSSATGAWA